MLRNFYKHIKLRLSKRYRVELIDDLTLSQSRQYFLKPITVLIIGALLLIGIVGGTMVLFIYTPALHQMIPQYEAPELVRKKDRRIDSLENVLARERANSELWIAQVQSATGLKQDSNEIQSSLDVPDMPVFPEPEVEEGQEISYVAYTEEEAMTPSRTLNRAPDFGLHNLFSPVKGEVVNAYNPFDEVNPHYGVDIVADEHTLIRSAADGYVVISEYSNDNGWVIGVVSKGNIVTFYKHNSRLLKEAGTYVYAGEPIAVIGNSGENSSGMHLHLELWQNGRPIDPEPHFEFN